MRIPTLGRVRTPGPASSSRHPGPAPGGEGLAPLHSPDRSLRAVQAGHSLKVPAQTT
ncbi:hypothetical protein [Methanosphaerula subterraneus]|uniref:hypothetical protein n=1 Tax=Methanosphaerula subterraneus TaxID=3350244 RepID=UPI003F8286BE